MRKSQVNCEIILVVSNNNTLFFFDEFFFLDIYNIYLFMLLLSVGYCNAATSQFIHTKLVLYDQTCGALCQ